jgi:hypothetical protein
MLDSAARVESLAQDLVDRGNDLCSIVVALGLGPGATAADVVAEIGKRAADLKAAQDRHDIDVQALLNMVRERNDAQDALNGVVDHLVGPGDVHPPFENDDIPAQVRATMQEWRDALKAAQDALHAEILEHAQSEVEIELQLEAERHAHAETKRQHAAALTDAEERALRFGFVAAGRGVISQEWATQDEALAAYRAEKEKA